jgi:hypothetical protein
MKEILIYKYKVLGFQRFSNLFWAIFIFVSSLNFLIISYKSYQINIGNNFELIDNSVLFFPQGLLMGFYSLLGLLFSIFSFTSHLLRLGYGFNEFNKKENIVRLFRWGFPGINRRIQICYSIEDVKSIKVNYYPERTIYLSLKGNFDIMLIRKGFFESIPLLEKQAINIAEFLKIPLVYE